MRGGLLVVALTALFCGCTRFVVEWPDGTRIERSGGFLVDADAHFKVWHEWIEEIEDAESGEVLTIPHVITVEQESFEDTRNQATAIELVIAALERAYGVRQAQTMERSRIKQLPAREAAPGE